jgi:iron complex transport system substrate-binding protein
MLLAGCEARDAAPRPVSEAPMRIVSMNPCVDAILREVAAPGQIASISHYSHDPRATSVPLDWARGYPANNGSAEDVIAAEPDLVIAGPHVAVQTVAALERLGIALMQVPVPQSVAQSKAQITEIADRIGRIKDGQAANARIDAALARARWAGTPASALIWQGGGLVPGKGTLADDLLARSGFANVAPALGLGQWDVLSLEGLLMDPPQVVLSGDENMDSGGADANRMLSHPALRKAGRRIHISSYPSNLLHCGGPVIVPALARLAKVRREVEALP